MVMQVIGADSRKRLGRRSSTPILGLATFSGVEEFVGLILDKVGSLRKGRQKNANYIIYMMYL